MAKASPRDPVIEGSPYRVPGPVAPSPSVELPAFRRRSWRLGLTFAAVVGSLFVHASLLAASALGRPTAAPPASEKSQIGTGAFVVHPEFTWPQFGCAWPPPPAIAACFDVDTLRRGPYTVEPFMGYGEAARSDVSWAPVPSPLPQHDDREAASAIFHDELSECAQAAATDGFRGEGRVFVRVTRDEAGAALTQVLPLDEEANHAGLLCCLRMSQSNLAAEMRPGTTVRYVLTAPPGQGLTLTPDPLE